ncbi:hypothetical protein [Pseudomonas protegens]|uniref:hypothetical protein n=1 Tax=Pseudomonas protegens TaxID=380021 RepID=UPI000F47C5A0|nr:hypothetical protein [Pseudomonas protegens]ROL86504.1 hypothetical protein BK639_28280 [Pseudomonas protegens]ROL95157.1 hypothetical protein BK640_29160 [Pseudomonas protegens]ROL97852.1 hypothetical protein BK641_26945 [Pseudomonas protegens]ROM07639.1 hypothetical protein BK642_13845 [Pseudomonas protegens]
MILEHVATWSAGLIALWATWCCLSGKVRDGVLGKLIYATIALSGYALLVRNDRLIMSQSVAEATLYASLALAGVRHVFMVIYWQRVKVWLCRALNCEHCLRCDIRKDRVERRKS